MRKHLAMLVGAVVVLGLIFYFSGSGPFANIRNRIAVGTAEAEVKGKGTAPSGAERNPVSPEKVPGSVRKGAGKTVEKPPASVAPADEGGAEAPTVEITPDMQKRIGVKTTTAVVQPLMKTIRTVGYAEYDQRRLNTVNTKIEGWVEKLYVNFTGIYVKIGDPVADIYSPELWATQQEFINMVEWAKRSRARSEKRAQASQSSEAGPDVASMIDKDAQSLVDAARQRLKLWDISDAQIQKIEESEKPIRTLTLYSPYSGYVLQKYVNEGQRVMAGQKLLDVADLSSIWIWADIYEYELPLVKVGDTAAIELSYLPGKRFSTQIDYINPVLEGETRTAKARFTLPNPGDLIKPQMFTNVGLTINLGRSLVVPTDAVIDTGVRKIAYVDRGDGNFEPREVATGTRTDKMVEITAGLKAGEKVASAANFLIDSEAKLKGVQPLPLKPAASNANLESRITKPGKSGMPSSPAPPAHRH